jgi:hypothetical protein
VGGLAVIPNACCVLVILQGGTKAYIVLQGNDWLG